MQIIIKRKTAVVILISDKVEFGTTTANRNKERHNIKNISVNIPRNITSLNVYASSNGVSKYLKQNLIELKGEIYKPTTLPEPEDRK